MSNPRIRKVVWINIIKTYSLKTVIFKTTVVHTVTYSLIGLLAYTLLDYTSLYSDPAIVNLMRQTSDPLVASGPVFQVLRGILFGFAFYPLREIVFARKNGWLILWFLLVIIGILSTFGPSPSSIEGMIYTVLPLWFHITGLPEVLCQSFLLALLTHYWINSPTNKWVSRFFIAIFMIVILMSSMGILVGLGIIEA